MDTPNRFRFRAWDKQKNHMLRVVEIYQSGRLAGAFEHPPASRAEPWSKEPVLSYHIETLPHDRVILMQSTGICDKKGKEIFEWDICKLFRPHGNHVKWIGAISWVGSMWCIISSFAEEYGLCGDSLEVIGNIHENPELL